MSTEVRTAPRPAAHLSEGRTGRVLLATLVLAAGTSSWTGFRISGLNLTDGFLVAGALFALLGGLVGRFSLQLRWQFVVLPVVVIALMARDAVFFDRLPFQALTAALYTTGDSLGETIGGSATFLARLLLSWTVIGLALSVFRGQTRRLLVIGGAWVTGVVVSALWAVAETLGSIPELPFLYHVDSLTRAVGLSNHPNSLAETISAALPLLVFNAFGPHATPLRRVCGLAATFVCLWSLFFSGSRAGLAMGCVAVVGAVLIRFRWSGRGIWGVPIGLLAIGGGILFLPRVWDTTRFSATSGQVSNSARLQALGQGWSLFEAHPFAGGGLSTWLGEMVPLILLSGGGVVLFATFYASIGAVFAHLWKARSGEFSVQLAWCCIVILLFGLLNNGLVERYLYWPFVLGFFLMPGSTRRTDPTSYEVSADSVPGYQGPR